MRLSIVAIYLHCLGVLIFLGEFADQDMLFGRGKKVSFKKNNLSIFVKLSSCLVF